MSLYNTYIAFLANAHWGYSLLAYLIGILLVTLIAGKYARALMSGSWSFIPYASAIVGVSFLMTYPTALWTHWISFGWIGVDGIHTFLCWMLVPYAGMILFQWVAIRHYSTEPT